MYKITMIGQHGFHHVIATPEKGAEFFARMGFTWYEALAGVVPAFTVTKLKSNEVKEFQKVG
jgi:hypothetical protein